MLHFLGCQFVWQWSLLIGSEWKSNELSLKCQQMIKTAGVRGNWIDARGGGGSCLGNGKDILAQLKVLQHHLA